MADKATCLENLEKIKKQHKQKLIKIELLLSQERIKEDSQKDEACLFHRWILQNPFAKEALGPQLFEKVHAAHIHWHTYYDKIVTLLYGAKKGLLHTFFGAKPSSAEIDKAKAYLDDLRLSTQTLDQIITICQRRVNALSPLKFQNAS